MDQSISPSHSNLLNAFTVSLSQIPSLKIKCTITVIKLPRQYLDTGQFNSKARDLTLRIYCCGAAVECAQRQYRSAFDGRPGSRKILPRPPRPPASIPVSGRAPRANSIEAKPEGPGVLPIPGLPSPTPARQVNCNLVYLQYIFLLNVCPLCFMTVCSRKHICGKQTRSYLWLVGLVSFGLQHSESCMFPKQGSGKLHPRLRKKGGNCDILPVQSDQEASLCLTKILILPVDQEKITRPITSEGQDQQRGPLVSSSNWFSLSSTAHHDVITANENTGSEASDLAKMSSSPGESTGNIAAAEARNRKILATRLWCSKSFQTRRAPYRNPTASCTLWIEIYFPSIMMEMRPPIDLVPDAKRNSVTENRCPFELV